MSYELEFTTQEGVLTIKKEKDGEEPVTNVTLVEGGDMQKFREHLGDDIKKLKDESEPTESKKKDSN